MRAFVKMAFVACALFLFMAAHLHASVKLPSGKGFLETREHKGQEVFSLADLVRAMGGSAGKDPVSQYPVWETNGHRVVLSTNTPMASVDGKIISLKSTPVEIGGDILLGTDFIGAVLPKIGFRLDEEISPGNGDHKNAQTRQPAPDGKVTVEKTVAYDLIRITFNGSMARHPNMGVAKIGFSAKGSIRRSEWGLDFGIPALGDEVSLVIETQLVPADYRFP